jgi:hypothetical protein
MLINGLPFFNPYFMNHDVIMSWRAFAKYGLVVILIKLEFIVESIENISDYGIFF